MSDKIKFQKL